MSGATAVVYVNDYIMLVHCYRAMTMCGFVTALQRQMATVRLTRHARVN